ncbi:IclR family transcriptional regulator [Microlunatus sp. GCM10028923]|uniref:IclR family transcriptional regulator n=1 Tax=Microlunatus sp. GCM10028923 TaxID=3273400 RepID=UPI00361AD66A
MAQRQVQSVDRALGLLWRIHRQPGRSLTELAAEADLLPSTALRLLATLARHDLIERDPDSRGYRIGSGAAILAGTVGADQQRLRDVLEPELRALAHAAREQAALGVLDGDRQFNIAFVDGASAAGEDVILRPRGLTRNSNLNATAIGKVLLAYLPEPRVEEIIAGLGFEQTARRTITDADRLRRELAAVRRAGCATSLDENTPEVCGIAAPVRDASGEVVAALSINGPTIRLPRARLRALLPILMEAAARSSRLLGQRG